MSTLFDPIAQARAAGAVAIESSICNGPFVEPTCFWQVVDFKTGERTEPTLKEGRRPAGYFFAPRDPEQGPQQHVDRALCGAVPESLWPLGEAVTRSTPSQKLER